MNRFKAVRQKYKPERIKYLFVTETPPKSTSDSFFYFENVSKTKYERINSGCVNYCSSQRPKFDLLFKK